MKKLLLLVLLVAILVVLLVLLFQNKAVGAPENQSEDQRLQWFRDAKFGMFIHWGVYSMLG